MATQNSFQERLAFWVVVIGSIVAGVCAITAIVATAIGSADGKSQTATAAKDILSITLPVLGTWIGTVLAFYFGKENYKAAAEETRLTLGQKLARPAKDFAIPLSKVQALTAADDAAARAITLAAIDAHLTRTGFYRVPILTQSNRPLYVIHRQPLDTFIAAQARAQRAPTAIAALTLDDLLKDPTEGPRIQDAFATLPDSATLADAKAAIESRPHCQDAFLTTPSGKPTDPVAYWLTNNEIQREARA